MAFGGPWQFRLYFLRSSPAFIFSAANGKRGGCSLKFKLKRPRSARWQWKKACHFESPRGVSFSTHRAAFNAAHEVGFFVGPLSPASLPEGYGVRGTVPLVFSAGPCAPT